MDEIKSPYELERRLRVFRNETDKIFFLEDYLRQSQKIEIEMIATIYETLGELHFNSGRPKGNFFQKAGSAWETAAVLDRGGREYELSKKGCFLQAEKNYKRALSIYKKEKYLTGIEEARRRIQTVKGELKNYGGPARTISIFLTLSLLVLSFFMLSPQFTGRIITADAGETSIVGLALTILGVIGVIVVLVKWR